MNKTDLVLHPVRMRIIQRLHSRALTTAQLTALLPEVPPATMYRHLRKLLDAGIVRVTASRQARGAVERTYEVAETSLTISREEFAAIPADKHREYYRAFVGSTLAAFEQYMDTKPTNVNKDGFRYFAGVLYLTEEEFNLLWTSLRELLSARASEEPAELSTRRMISIHAVPLLEPDGDLNTLIPGTREPEEKE